MPARGKTSGMAILFGEPKPKGKPMMEEEPMEQSAGSESIEGDYDAAFDTAAREAFDALKNDDAEAFASAFKRAVQSCMDKG